jgi:uncharacterized protein
MTSFAKQEAFFPGQASIDSYGNGGFRFADMSHRGSILILPSGIYGWPVSSMDELRVDAFARVFAEAEQVEFLLLGSGTDMIRPSAEMREAFRNHGVGLEFMSTGAAARTYNILLSEKRAVAAALIAVDSAR